MNAGIRRLLALGVVFFTAFAAVTILRHWRSGAPLRTWLNPEAGQEGTFRPEHFTLPEQAPLEGDDVELLSRLNGEYARVTRAVVPSVVSINTAGTRIEQLTDAWGRARVRQFPTQGQGSGVIVSREGHVVTNHHVIAGQEKIQVTLHNGKRYPASLIGEDRLLDIAVLKIEGDNGFTPLKFGDSAQVEVGQIVFAVGNPFGLGETFTQGIISAKERSISDNQRDLFQTDAAINPGNSGGPLVNLRGEIVGINVAIYSPDRDNPGFQGVGFSIPANDVKNALVQILEKGRPVYGYLGLRVQPDLDASVRAAIGYEGKDGVALTGVSAGSPAEAAGLQPWDVIQEYNGERIESMGQLMALIQRTKIGQEVPLTVWRKGQVLTLKAVISEGAATATREEPAASKNRARDPDEVLQAVGIEVRDLVVQERLRGFRGVVATRVLASGLAAGKIQPGDLIGAVNQAAVGSANEFFIYLAASIADQPTTLTVLREGRVERIELPALPPKETAPEGR